MPIWGDAKPDSKVASQGTRHQRVEPGRLVSRKFDENRSDASDTNLETPIQKLRNFEENKVCDGFAHP